MSHRLLGGALPSLPTVLPTTGDLSSVFKFLGSVASYLSVTLTYMQKSSPDVLNSHDHGMAACVICAIKGTGCVGRSQLCKKPPSHVESLRCVRFSLHAVFVLPADHHYVHVCLPRYVDMHFFFFLVGLATL